MMECIARPLRNVMGLLIAAGALGLCCGTGAAETGRTVYLALSFNAEGETIPTTACLRVTERAYPQSRWWEDPSRVPDAPERALKAVIAAIREKDRAALYDLSHPTLGRDVKQFDEQARAYFSQFATIELIGIPRAYEFDDLTVFFGKFRFKEQTLFAPLTFAAERDGSFGFLPYRTDKLSYRLVEDWFQPRRGPAGRTDPSYCSDVEVGQATHRVALAPSPVGLKPPPRGSVLFLTGAAFDKPGALVNLVTRTKSEITGMKAALAAGDVDAFATHLTPAGAKRLRDWFVTADQNHRRQYKSWVVERQPFFLFDLTSLVVVYTRSPSAVQAMYFAVGANGSLRWLNSSYVTVWDQVFQRGPLYDAALRPNPFGNLAAK